MKYLILGMLLVLVIAAACKKAETPTGPETPEGGQDTTVQPDTAINGTVVDDNATQQIDQGVDDAVDDINNW
jgi:hypothetical protein